MDSKRFISLILSFVTALGLSSCASKPVPDGTPDVISNEGVLIESVPETSSEPEQEAEPEPEIQEEETIVNDIPAPEQLTEEFRFLEGLPTEQVPWGPGTNRGSDGRPIACVQLQQQYGKYGAMFVRTEDENRGKVFLTFDEGYENGYTGAILDTLREKGVSAVFFVTLPYVKSCPDLVRRMIDEGHIVGNHTSAHPNLTTLSAMDGYDDIAKLHKYVEENFGYSMYLFRFPEGAFSEQNLGLLQSMGYQSVFWSFAYSDWDAENQPDPQKAYERITGSLHDGEIFLLHAVSKTNSDILGNVIDFIRQSGYSIEKYRL